MFADRRLANIVSWSALPRADANMRLPDEVLKCVAYVCRPADKNGVQAMETIGTGFFVSLKIPLRPDLNFIYFLTAKHVALNVNNSQFYLRMNLKIGESAYIDLTGAKWVFHESEDVAIFAWAPQSNTVDYKLFQSYMMLDEDDRMQRGIGVGDEIFIVGLFSYHEGRKKIYPIVRVGNIAMIPGEPIVTKKCGRVDAYLVEARSIGGLSGSPVFVMSRDKDFKPNEIHLLGLVHGHYDISEDVEIDQVVDDKRTRQRNPANVSSKRGGKSR
jgi:hypothetical protein